MSGELQIPELNPVAKKIFPTAQKKKDKGLCPMCGTAINEVDDFKDELSVKEYTISGMCQKCQDELFG